MTRVKVIGVLRNGEGELYAVTLCYGQITMDLFSYRLSHLIFRMSWEISRMGNSIFHNPKLIGEESEHQ